ncbi:hypothetical protein, partial [Escherichia coli]|uniref:hypothetical protein n=1 Tax=Escherichia coli TaxID=562 RepID=UPI00227F4689
MRTSSVIDVIPCILRPLQRLCRAANEGAVVRPSHEIGKTPPRRSFRTGLTCGGRVDQPGAGGVDAELLAA